MYVEYSFDQAPNKAQWNSVADSLRSLIKANEAFTMKGKYRLHSLFQRTDSPAPLYRSFKPHSVKVGRVKHPETDEDFIGLCWGSVINTGEGISNKFDLVRCNRVHRATFDDEDFAAVVIAWLVLLSNDEKLGLRVSLASVPERVKSKVRKLATIDGMMVLPDWLTGRVEIEEIVRPESLDFRA